MTQKKTNQLRMTPEERQRKKDQKKEVIAELLAEAKYVNRGSDPTVADVCVQKYRDRYRESTLQTLADLDIGKCNPYLLAASGTDAAHIVQEYVSAKFSSADETCFGQLLEDIAGNLLDAEWIPRAERKRLTAEERLTNSKIFGHGVDLKINRTDEHGVQHVYIVSIKSGQYWGNSSSHAAQAAYFEKAKLVIPTRAERERVMTLMVVGYGRANHLIDYAQWELVGQQAWTFITGDSRFYLRVAELLREGAGTFDARIRQAKLNAETRIMTELARRKLLTVSRELDILALVRFRCQNEEVDG